MNSKECNREEFQKQYLYSKKKKQFALDMVKKKQPQRLDIINVDQKELKTCSCAPSENGRRTHVKDCSQSFRLSRQILKSKYIDYKTEYNYFRDDSPGWRFARQIEKEIQFRKDKTRLKQQVLKGKQFIDGQFY